eukprot:1179810-Prorocentrum_minimum.AAC.2
MVGSAGGGEYVVVVVVSISSSASVAVPTTPGTAAFLFRLFRANDVLSLPSGDDPTAAGLNDDCPPDDPTAASLNDDCPPRLPPHLHQQHFAVTTALARRR